MGTGGTGGIGGGCLLSSTSCMLLMLCRWCWSVGGDGGGGGCCCTGTFDSVLVPVPADAEAEVVVMVAVVPWDWAGVKRLLNVGNIFKCPISVDSAAPNDDGAAGFVVSEGGGVNRIVVVVGVKGTRAGPETRAARALGEPELNGAMGSCWGGLCCREGGIGIDTPVTGAFGGGCVVPINCCCC